MGLQQGYEQGVHQKTKTKKKKDFGLGGCEQGEREQVYKDWE